MLFYITNKEKVFPLQTQTPKLQPPLTHNHNGVIKLHLIFLFFGLSFDHDILFSSPTLRGRKIKCFRAFMVLVISRKKLRIESAKVFFVAICERERERE